MFNRRLYLFWPVIDKVPDESQSLQSEEEQRTFLRIGLAWSEYKNGKWSAKKVSGQYPIIDTKYPAENVDHSLLSFAADTGQHGKIAAKFPVSNVELRIPYLFAMWEGDSSFDFDVHGDFLFAGCGMKQLADPHAAQSAQLAGRFPYGTKPSYMGLEEMPAISSSKTVRNYVPQLNVEIDLLKLPPGGAFQLLFPHQHE